jgi:aspartate aminotransferase
VYTTSGPFGLIATQMENSLVKTYDLSLGEPRLSPFPLEILADLVGVKDLNVYYPSHGSVVLRKLLLEKYYAKCNLTNITITHGAIGALDVIMRVQSHIGGEILLPDPGFPPYEKLAQFSKLKIKKYKVNLDKNNQMLVDWQDLYSQVTNDTKLLLINSPSNPTGKLFGQQEKQRLLQMMSEFPNLNFILDEAYRELIYAGLSHVELSEFIDRGYIVGSFSKMYPLQGARVGWVLTSEKLMQEMSPYFNNAYGAISSFGQEMARILIEKNVNYFPQYNEARIRSLNILDQSGVEHLSALGGLFHFINFRKDDLKVTAELREKGVLVVPGSAFGSQGIGYVRVCFSQPKQDLQKAFEIIADHWFVSKKENL